MKITACFSETEIIRCVCGGEHEITGLCTDSREAAPGKLFVALAGVAEGARHGSEFAADALTAGAIPVLDRLPDTALEKYVLVPDARRALSDVALTFYGHPERELKLLGVTGTKGKTTVTHLLKHVLERCTGEKAGLIGTNHILIGEEEYPSPNTTPEADKLIAALRAMADAGCAYAVMEVSSHSLFLGRVRGLRFACAAFLNLTHDHLDFHKTMENYAAAKALIFRQADRAVINADADFADLQLEAAKDLPTITFSCEKNTADLIAKDIRFFRSRIAFAVGFRGETDRVTLGIPGRFSAYNALAVIGMACALGLSLSDVTLALADAKGVPGRCETVETDGDYCVLVDYAHTPDSLQNILKTARDFTKGRLICIFGCGGNRDRTKRPEMGAIAAELANLVYVTSDNPRREDPEEIIREIMAGISERSCRIRAITDRRTAIRAAIDEASSEDTVVIAGKGHEDYQEINGVKHHFDDHEEARAAIEERKRRT